MNKNKYKVGDVVRFTRYSDIDSEYLIGTIDRLPHVISQRYLITHDRGWGYLSLHFTPEEDILGLASE